MNPLIEQGARLVLSLESQPTAEDTNASLWIECFEQELATLWRQ
jgi:hypothetical protein